MLASNVMDDIDGVCETTQVQRIPDFILSTVISGRWCRWWLQWDHPS